ncbi:MAG: hypothetical protein ACKOX7_05750, partial [Bacteroidota bacterium]
LDSQAGPCSDVDLKTYANFQTRVLSFLTQDSDSNLVTAFQSNSDLLESFQVEMGCYSADQIRNLALESKSCLKSIIEDRSFHLQMKSWENSRRGLFIPSNEKADSSLWMLRTVLFQDHAVSPSNDGADSIVADTHATFLTSPSTAQSVDSLKFHLSVLISKMNVSYNGFMSERELESARLAEARLQHGLRVGEARTRLFLFTLISWMISLSLMSALYLKSVFRRSSSVPLVVGDNAPIADNSNLAEVEILSGGKDISSRSAIILDYDLTKVFFDSGGDIQTMKKRLNQHLVSSFAAIGNLKSYQRSGNADGIIRILKVLSESNQSLGFIDLKNRLDEASSSIDLSRNNPAQWGGLESVISELTNQIEIIKERMDHHPAFKG